MKTIVFILILLNFFSYSLAQDLTTPRTCSSLLSSSILNKELILSLAEYGVKLHKLNLGTDAELFIKYKNDSDFAGWLVHHLNGDSLPPEPSQLLMEYEASSFQSYRTSRSWDLRRGDYLVQQSSVKSFSNYDISVLGMRDGDKILLPNGEKTIELTLGEYLGAGNQTMVFGIRDKPGLVLRLPFRSKNFRYLEFELELNEARRTLLQMARSHPETDKFRAIEIDSYGLGGEYMVVEKIEGVSGTEFIVENAHLVDHFKGKSESETLPGDIEDYAIENFLSISVVRGILQRYWMLENLMFEALDLVSDVHHGQFMWDVSSQEWVLIDWDPY